MNERTRAHELAPYVMSLPGVGIGIAGVLPAYLGNGERFEKAAQAANYAGFTPRVDCSGEMERYGSTARRQFCHPIRAVMLEGVWGMTRSGSGGTLLAKYRSLNERMGKKKSAAAVARKLVILAWLLLKRREFYNGTTEAALERKLKYYKIRRENGQPEVGTESLARQLADQALNCQAENRKKKRNTA